MAEATKLSSINAGKMVSELKKILPRTRINSTFLYGSTLVFLLFTLLLAFNLSSNASSRLGIIFPSSGTSFRSQFFPIFSQFFPNSSLPNGTAGYQNNAVQWEILCGGPSAAKDRTQNEHSSDEVEAVKSNRTTSSGKKFKKRSRAESPMKCDLFDGEWVRDDSYPLYKPGSCSLMDKQFNCFLNGRPDDAYHKLKWKPKGCPLPRLDGKRMLKLLRGKRLVFVGDSLNRNMWESLVCILRNSVKDRSKVYEASGRHHFRNEASYSFVFEDHNCTVEFFASPFLVREWEVRNGKGSKRETLRLDLMGSSAPYYRSADIIVFNTGHWWTHEKTSKGKNYYQEGSHVYRELDALEAYRRALRTWGRWVDANVNPSKTQVFFRGYSPSHFSGGQWNSGGQCDGETEPIKKQTYLAEYPEMMKILERALKGMKTGVSYMNVTRMSDYRKDGHPSIYRKPNMTAEEIQSEVQDCSHWCLPGVPDAWNELLYAQLLAKPPQYR